jgi:SAM-dependent methyltransferase
MRDIKRKVSPYRSDLAENDFTIELGLLQIQWLGPCRGRKVLEIGSGWEPLIPLLHYLSGAEIVYLTDLRRLLDKNTFKAAVQSMQRKRETITQALRLSNEEFQSALAYDEQASLDAILQRFRLSYLAPCDCRSLPMPEESLDVVFSNAVLEHIPREIIAAILKEGRRILKPEGKMLHVVDNSDHWQHNDSSISRINFLTLSDWVFRLTYINSIRYQNRLRHSEYLSLLEECGLRIVRQDGKVDAGAMRDLPHLKLAPRFRQFSPQDVCTITSCLLAQRFRNPAAGEPRPEYSDGFGCGG